MKVLSPIILFQAALVVNVVLSQPSDEEFEELRFHLEQSPAPPIPARNYKITEVSPALGELDRTSNDVDSSPRRSPRVSRLKNPITLRSDVNSVDEPWRSNSEPKQAPIRSESGRRLELIEILRKTYGRRRTSHSSDKETSHSSDKETEQPQEKQEKLRLGSRILQDIKYEVNRKSNRLPRSFPFRRNASRPRHSRREWIQNLFERLRRKPNSPVLLQQEADSSKPHQEMELPQFGLRDELVHQYGNTPPQNTPWVSQHSHRLPQHRQSSSSSTQSESGTESTDFVVEETQFLFDEEDKISEPEDQISSFEKLPDSTGLSTFKLYQSDRVSRKKQSIAFASEVFYSLIIMSVFLGFFI